MVLLPCTTFVMTSLLTPTSIEAESEVESVNVNQPLKLTWSGFATCWGLGNVRTTPLGPFIYVVKTAPVRSKGSGLRALNWKVTVSPCVITNMFEPPK